MSFLSSLSGRFSFRRHSPTTRDDLAVHQRERTQEQQRVTPQRRKSAPPVRSSAKHKARKMTKCKKSDTNVILVSMKDLDQLDNIATGDPVYCDGCQVVLSCISDTVQEGDKLLWKW